MKDNKGKFIVNVSKDTVINFINDNDYPVLFKKIERVTNNKRTRIYITYECSCGDTVTKLWDKFKHTHYCADCGVKNRKSHLKYTYEFVLNYFKEIDYTLLNEYRDAATNLEYKCNKCGNISKSNFTNLFLGRRCRTCSGLSKKTTEIFKHEVNIASDGEYSLQSEYENGKVKVKIKHEECGHLYDVTPINFISGKRCPKCKMSKGEKKISECLISRDINFSTQFRIDDCRNTYPLPFDFVILNKSGEIIHLIEYDGIQHFKPIKHFGGVDALNQTLFNDDIKNTYCKSNDIPLLRIPYFDFENIELILEQNIIKSI